MRPSIMSVRPWHFFTLTYLLSWAIWVPLVLAHWQVEPFRIAEETSTIVRLLGVLMPAVAALLLTARAGGWVGVQALLGRLASWRVGWEWWGAAVVAQPVLLVLVTLIVNLFSGQAVVRPLPMLTIGTLLINAVILTLATVGEEIGWHGLALPALQAQRSAMHASWLLGFLMAGWHLPFWLLLDSFDQYGVGYLVLNVLFILPVTFYITWFFNHTRGTLLLPVGFHLSFNLVNVAWLPVTLDLAAFALLIVAEWLLAFLVLPYLEPDARARPRLRPVG